MSASLDPLAHALAAAIRAGRAAPAASLDANALSMADAYDVQARVVQALGGRVAGWKCGFGPDGHSVAAPLIAERREAERRDDPAAARPAGDPRDRDRVQARARPAAAPGHGRTRSAEIADVGRSRADRRRADRGPRRHAVRGNALRALRRRPAGQRGLRVRRRNAGLPRARPEGAAAGRCRSTASACTRALGGHPQGDPWAPLVAWSNAQCDRLGGLKAGQVITTGSCSPPRPIDKPCKVRATIDGIGDVAFAFNAAHWPGFSALPDARACACSGVGRRPRRAATIASANAASRANARTAASNAAASPQPSTSTIQRGISVPLARARFSAVSIALASVSATSRCAPATPVASTTRSSASRMRVRCEAARSSATS